MEPTFHTLRMLSSSPKAGNRTWPPSADRSGKRLTAGGCEVCLSMTQVLSDLPRPQLEEKQSGVAHKPAYYYRFDKEVYEETKKASLGFNF